MSVRVLEMQCYCSMNIFQNAVFYIFCAYVILFVYVFMYIVNCLSLVLLYVCMGEHQ